MNPISDVYTYDPLKGLKKDQKKLVIGIQGTMWTHVARQEVDIQRQVFPRLLAVAESAWLRGSRKDLYDFQERLKSHYAHLDRFGVAYWIDTAVGTWDPSMLDEQVISIEWRIEDKIDENGDFIAHFQYSGGAHCLQIHKVELLRDGKIISTDEHFGYTGANHAKNTYNLKVSGHKAGAGYSLRAHAVGGDGLDSNGAVGFSRACR